MAPAPPTTVGCTVNGTNVGDCCEFTSVSVVNGYTICSTSAQAVSQLQACLTDLLLPSPENPISCATTTSITGLANGTNNTNSSITFANAAASSPSASGVINSKFFLVAAVAALAVTVLADAA